MFTYKANLTRRRRLDFSKHLSRCTGKLSLSSFQFFTFFTLIFQTCIFILLLIHQLDRRTSAPNLDPLPPSNGPEVIVFRRTRKTGSSSMLSELIREFTLLGYETLNEPPPEMKWRVRKEDIKIKRGRLFVAEHNDITRADYHRGQVVIIDTVRDGYQQVTSFCRYLKKIRTCNKLIEECMESNASLVQNRYRWGGRPEEDDDTYIDLPISSAHMYLSTTVLRTIFPEITLRPLQINVMKSSCPENGSLRKIYRRLYGELDEQVNMLKKRMLVIAGYPFRLHAGTKIKSLDELLDAADLAEKAKYVNIDVSPSPVYAYGFPKFLYHQKFGTHLRWMRDDSGSLALLPWHNSFTPPNFTQVE